MIEADTELVIFDADGTLRYVTVPNQHYPLRPEQWRLMPNVVETMARLPIARLKFGIASNQHGVGLGQLARAAAESMLIASWSAAFAGNAPAVSIEMCVCLPDSNCDRRKPMPGMLHALLRRHRVPPQRALYIGDLAIDALAAERAGMRFQFAQRFFEPNSAPTDSP